MFAMVDKTSIQKPDMALITPFIPEESYLINKLTGSGMTETSQGGNASKRMPAMSEALCDEVIEVIEQWITDGAK